MKKVIFGVAVTVVAVLIGLAGRTQADEDFYDGGHFEFLPGNLVVSRSVYDNNPNNVMVGEILPPDCASTTGGCSASTGAPYNGSFPQVFNNDAYDGSFGITSKLYLDQLTPFGWYLDTLPLPSDPSKDHLVTSFSSKSEGALNLSLDHKYLTFIDYVAPINTIDVSNSNTFGNTNPTNVDPTNPVGESYYRAVAIVNAEGQFHFTETNAYSGNNGRAAIWNNVDGANVVYTAGNAGNGSNPEPPGILLGAGTQIITPSTLPESAQNPGVPTPAGSFNVTQLGLAADKTGKDDNFRGLTIFNNVVYLTKGSGSNGIDTVYFIDTTGKACPTTGIGLPVAGAALPTSPLSYSAANLVPVPPSKSPVGLPSNMCVLAGFPSALASTFPGFPTGANPAFPFGIWFANATTVYVADEGDGYAGGSDLYTHAASEGTPGLQKWVFDAGTQKWTLAYTLQTGLELGVPYTVPGYPAVGVLNPATCVVPVPPAPNPNKCATSKTLPLANSAPNGLPWAPATDGLRNITGRVEWDGRVTIWGVTSTVSGNGDQGADPNRLVSVTDVLANTSSSVAATETFSTLRTAQFAEVLRGVSFTPTGDRDSEDHDREDHDRGRDDDGGRDGFGFGR